MSQRREQILERVLSREVVPSLSAVAVRLVELAASETAGADDLAAVIEKDPGLATRLLRLCNSAAYRLSEEEVTSINRAVVILGVREVRIMALSISLRDTLPVKRDGFDYQLFWRASLHRAVLGRETARRVAEDLMEEAFVAGLVQELGLPLLLGALEPEEAAGFPGMGGTLREQILWERVELDLDHRELGRAVLQRWGLPESLVACQQVVTAEGLEQLPPLALVADFARLATQAFFSPQRRFTDIYQAAWRRFALQSETVNEILASALSYVGEAAEILDIELDQGADLLAVMEKANSALTRLVTQAQPHFMRAMDGGEEERRLREETVVDTLEAVVHEIRNPLTSVGGFARRLAGQIAEEGSAHRYAQVLMAEAARLDQALAEMSSLVSPYQPKLAPVDLGWFLNEARRQVAVHPLEHVTGPPPPIEWHLTGEDPRVMADREGLLQVVRLMLSFGCHLAGSGAGASLAVHLLRKDDRALICVYGSGAPPPRGDGDLAGKSFGPELGLARARRMTEAMGGVLSVASSPHKGGFLLTCALPLAP